MSPPILAVTLAGAMLASAGATLAPAATAQTGQVICTTSLEVPPGSDGPVEVTRCGELRTVPELMRRRYFSYRAPYARGVDLTHQITDLLGIAMGGGDGSRVMGLGFPDQAITWDGTAVQNTTEVLLELQNDPLLRRTADLPTCFGGSLAGSACGTSPSEPVAEATWLEPVRGLW
jgi:hypothetical protein